MFPLQVLLSNGKFNTGGSIFGGSITIQHVIVLDVAIWIIHSYIIWRFWLLTKEAPARRFSSSLNHFIASNGSFKQLVTKYIAAHYGDNENRLFADRAQYIKRLPFSRTVNSGRGNFVKLPFLKTAFYEINALPKLVINEPHFSNTELPYILAAVPFYIVFFKNIF